MSKLKNQDAKKVLIRNAELSLPKTWNAMQSKELASSSNKSITKDHTKCITARKSTNISEFHTPEMQSTLKISKGIDDIVKPRKTKSLSDVNKTKLAVEEKLSRKVNFPYGQSVFKDLIPLCSREIKSQPIIVTRGPVLQKDPEPVLTDFIEPEEPNTQYYLPQYNKQPSNKCVSMTNALKLYKIIQINESRK